MFGWSLGEEEAEEGSAFQDSVIFAEHIIYLEGIKYSDIRFV